MKSLFITVTNALGIIIKTSEKMFLQFLSMHCFPLALVSLYPGLPPRMQVCACTSTQMYALLRSKRGWHWKSKPSHVFGFTLRKTGRWQASSLCWVWSLQDCTLFLVPAWVAQQNRRTSISSRGCGEGTDTRSPGKNASGNAPLLLGKTLFYTDNHFLRVRIHICYLLVPSLIISAELNQATESYLWY